MLPAARKSSAGNGILPARAPGGSLRVAALAQFPLVVAALLAVAAPAETVSYVLAPQPETGRLQVSITWTPRDRTQSVLATSKQAGSVTDVPALIKDLRFGGVTEVKSESPVWVLKHPRGGSLTIRYEIDPGARELTWNNTHAPVTSDVFFHGIGSAFLLAPQPGGSMPEQYDVTLRWQLPAGWKAASSLGVGAHVGARLSPNDLRNAVYLAGQIALHTAERSGRRVTVALPDCFGFTPAELADRATVIVTHLCDFMDEAEFPPTLVTAVPVGEAVKAEEARLAGAGLYQSLALWVAPQSRLTDAFENLFAHELFHHWNGRALKARSPDKLVSWFIEGFTDYYAWRILYESGHWPPETYAKWINRVLREYHRNPAIRASNQDIAERYWKERDTVGQVAYQRGLLLGLRWHRLARDRGVKEGLDALLHSLVQRARRESFELTNEMIRQAGVRTLGQWFGPEFDRYVGDAEVVDVPRDALAPAFDGRLTTRYEFDLGFDRQRSLGVRRVVGLKPGSAAEEAGLREGDELGGWKIRDDAEEPVELQVRREGRWEKVRYYPRGRGVDVLQFHPATRR